MAVLNTKTTYSEQDLVVLLKEQNREGFNYLYENYSAALFTIIHQIIADRETASDVLQEVFINIWRKADLYDAAKGRLFTWMLNIARNAAIDKLRSKDFRKSRQNQPLPENVDSGKTSSVHPEISDVGLKKMLGKLSPEHRNLIELSFFQGYTHEEIAKMLEIPLGTVKTRIRTSLSHLRKMI
jgi:RNA polymerase sigma factor (sigma-70 family)